MKGFSGFGNSPMKQSMSSKQLAEHKKSLIKENPKRANYTASDTTGAVTIASDLELGHVSNRQVQNDTEKHGSGGRIKSERSGNYDNSKDIYNTTKKRIDNDPNKVGDINNMVKKDLQRNTANKTSQKRKIRKGYRETDDRGIQKTSKVLGEYVRNIAKNK
jgi:hypothetical protein